MVQFVLVGTQYAYADGQWYTMPANISVAPNTTITIYADIQLSEGDDSPANLYVTKLSTGATRCLSVSQWFLHQGDVHSFQCSLVSGAADENLVLNACDVSTGTPYIHDSRCCFNIFSEETIGYLNVSSTPSGADIYIDGSDTGYNTPSTIAVNPGTYQVRVKKSGYDDPSIQTVTVAAGQTVNVPFTLSQSGTDTTLEWITIPDTATVGENVTLRALLQDDSGNNLIGATVTFYKNWSPFATDVTDGSVYPSHVHGIAEVTTSFAAAGNYVMRAKFAASGDYRESLTEERTIVVSEGGGATTNLYWSVGGEPPNKVTPNQLFDAEVVIKDWTTINGLNGLPIHFSIDDVELPNSPITTDTNSWHGEGYAAYNGIGISALGTHTLKAEFLGDAAYEPSSVSKTITVEAGAVGQFAAYPKTIPSGFYDLLGDYHLSVTVKNVGQETGEFAIHGWVNDIDYGWMPGNWITDAILDGPTNWPNIEPGDTEKYTGDISMNLSEGDIVTLELYQQGATEPDQTIEIPVAGELDWSKILLYGGAAVGGLIVVGLLLKSRSGGVTINLPSFLPQKSMENR